MTQGSERQGGGGVEAWLGPETIPVLKMVLHPFPAITGLVPTLTPYSPVGVVYLPFISHSHLRTGKPWPLEDKRALSSLEPWSGAGCSCVVRKSWFSHKALLERDKPCGVS